MDSTNNYLSQICSKLDEVKTRQDSSYALDTSVKAVLQSIEADTDAMVPDVESIKTDSSTTASNTTTIKTDFESVVGLPSDVDPIRGHNVAALKGDDPHSGKIVNILRHFDNYHENVAIRQHARFKQPSFSQPVLEAPGKEDVDGNGKIYGVDFVFKKDDELLPHEEADNKGLRPLMFDNAERDVDRSDMSIQKIAYSEYKKWIAEDSTEADPTTQYTLTVVSGTFVHNGSTVSTGSYSKGAKLTIYADSPPPGGAPFNHWSCTDPTAYISNSSATTITFGTPAANCTLTAVYS